MRSIKSENGMITMITLATILFMISSLVTTYILVANKVKTQKEMINETRSIYEPKSTMEEIYNSYFNNDNIIPIYTVQQLLMMGKEQKDVNINGKYYDFNNDENTIYILMNDLKFKASDYSDQLTNGYWTPIGDNTELIAKFEGRGHTIEVVYDNGSKIYSEENNYSDNEKETTGPWTENADGSITDGKQTLQIGDYVYYYPTSATLTSDSQVIKDLQKYSGYTGTNYFEDYPITGELNMEWRVLDVKNGKVRLISSTPTANTVYLYSYNGYNNGVYLLDEVCQALYSGKEGTAQNLKIEDIQDKLAYDYTQYENSYVDTNKYGGTKEYIDSGMSVGSGYPEIFLKEKTGWVNGVQGTEYDLSEQTELIDGVRRNTVKIKQTYWKKTMIESDFKKPIYNKLYMNGKYWLSSRCTDAGKYSCFYYMSTIINGSVNGGSCLTDSEETEYWGIGNAYSLRPVITLESNVQLNVYNPDETHNVV